MAVLAFFTLKLHIFARVTFGLLIEASLPSDRRRFGHISLSFWVSQFQFLGSPLFRLISEV